MSRQTLGPIWTRALAPFSLRGGGPPLRCGHLLGVLQGERCMRWSVAVRFRSHSPKELAPGELARGVAQVWVRGAGYRHLPVTVAAYGPGALGVWVCCSDGKHARKTDEVPW